MGAAPLYQLLEPAIRRMADAQWRRVGHQSSRRIVETENRVWVADSPQTQMQTRSPSAAPERTAQAAATNLPSPVKLGALLATAICVLILGFGGYWLAFGRQESTTPEIEVLSQRVTQLERQAHSIELPPQQITQTVNVAAPPARQSNEGQGDASERRVRRYTSY